MRGGENVLGFVMSLVVPRSRRALEALRVEAGGAQPGARGARRIGLWHVVFHRDAPITVSSLAGIVTSKLAGTARPPRRERDEEGIATSEYVLGHLSP